MGQVDGGGVTEEDDDQGDLGDDLDRFGVGRIGWFPNPKGERRMPMAVKTMGPEMLYRLMSLEK